MPRSSRTPCYGYDTIRVRPEAGAHLLEKLQGIVEVNDHGNLQEVRWRGDPQDLLQALSARTRIFQFEIARPSLHDIFVRIAAPEEAPESGKKPVPDHRPFPGEEL